MVGSEWGQGTTGKLRQRSFALLLMFGVSAAFLRSSLDFFLVSEGKEKSKRRRKRKRGRK